MGATTESGRTLYVRKVSQFDLFAMRCPHCDELTVHGFWNQLNRTLDVPKRRIRVCLTCQKCGLVVEKVYYLTTATRHDHRLCPWSRWFVTKVLPWMVRRRFSRRGILRVAYVLNWLERRLPI